MSDRILTPQAPRGYFHAGLLEIDNRPGQESLRVVFDELSTDDDAMLRSRFAETVITFADALADSEIAEDAHIVYVALRRIALTLTARHAAGKDSTNEPA
jgi:hypothetical protein